MDRYKRLVALAVTIVMLVAVLPMSTFAEEIPQQGDLPETFVSEDEPGTGAGFVDFSENNMLAAVLHPSAPDGYNYEEGVDRGGIADMATAYYARWGGPVLESDDPYPNPAIPANVQYSPNQPRAAMVTDALVVPNDIGTAATNISRIKQMVYDQGAVYISMQYDANGYMNWSTRAFYMPPNAVQQGSYGHAVTVVGWDDTYSKTNFKSGTQPSSDGAFIIKNSHGTGGSLDDGYFYLSYQDKCVGKLYKITQSESFNYTSDNVVYLANDASLYDNNYGYDPYGYTNAYSLTGTPETVYMANVFPATRNETLRAVSFYTNEYNVAYEVYIVTSSSVGGTLPAIASLNTATLKASGTQAYPGYHTVNLSTPVVLTLGQKFSVIIKISGSVPYPLCVEEDIVEINSAGEEVLITKNVTQNAQQSYVYLGSSWYDFASTYANFCIRAFTTNGIASGGAPTGGHDDEALQPDKTEEDNSDELSESAQPSGDEQEEQDADAPQGDEPATGAQPPLELVSYLDTLDLNEGDEPPTGSADEDGFIAGAKLQRYSLYFDRGGEPPTSGTLPAKYDLRDTGIITPVKDQGQIGSCWTFAATASVESTYMKLIKNTPIPEDFSLTVTRSAPYLRQGSSMTIEASASDESFVEGYTWSFSGGGFNMFQQGEGNRKFLLTAGVGAMENIISGSCTATLTSGIEVKKDFTIALTDYGATADGSAANPYQVNTAKKLEMINGFLGEDLKEVHFVQTADIDLSGVSWTPIGYYRSDTDNNPFMGSYDGGGYVISGFIPGVFDSEVSLAYGLFGYINQASLVNISFNNYTSDYTRLDTNNQQKLYHYGSIAGYAVGSTLQNCSVASKIFVNSPGIQVKAGGLVGSMEGGQIDHCAATYVDIIQPYINQMRSTIVGGLAGETQNVKVRKSYSDVYIGYSSVDTMVKIGGLIGNVLGGTEVDNSFVLGVSFTHAVAGNTTKVIAGMAHIGDLSNATKFTNCYTSMSYLHSPPSDDPEDYFQQPWGRDAAVLFGGTPTNITVSNCFYNSSADGVSNAIKNSSKNGTGKTAVQMGTQSAFTGFDFTNNWTMIQGNRHWSGISSFPALKNPLGTLTGGYSIPPTTFYSGDTIAVYGTQYPYHVWLQQVGVDVTHPKIVLGSPDSGLIKGGEYGTTTVKLVAGGEGGTVLNRIDNFSVITRPGDLNFTGTPQYPLAITLLLDLLTGKPALYNNSEYEHYYVLNADRADDTAFDITREDISLSDLVRMKQLVVGAYATN